jgi:hypothetical protein
MAISTLLKGDGRSINQQEYTTVQKQVLKGVR